MKIFDLLVELELSLHSVAIRSSRNKLEALLSDEFMEIGASGKIYDKAQIINSLLIETPRKVKAGEFEFRQLSSELVQLIYKSENTRRAVRSSIWRLEDGQWRMIFHQGTVTG